jgi:hypothetical protein
MRKFFNNYGILMCVAVITTLVFMSKNERKDNLSLRNIGMLQVSAGEAWCEDVSDHKCKLTVDSTVLEGTGQPKAVW